MTYFLFTSVILLKFLSKMTYLNNFKQFSSLKLKFHLEHDVTSGSQNCKTGSDRETKLAAVTKDS